MRPEFELPLRTKAFREMSSCTNQNSLGKIFVTNHCPTAYYERIGALPVKAADSTREEVVSDHRAEPPAADEPSPKTEQFLNLLGAHERSLFAYVYSLAPNWQDA